MRINHHIPIKAANFNCDLTHKIFQIISTFCREWNVQGSNIFPTWACHDNGYILINSYLAFFIFHFSMIRCILLILQLFIQVIYIPFEKLFLFLKACVPQGWSSANFGKDPSPDVVAWCCQSFPSGIHVLIATFFIAYCTLLLQNENTELNTASKRKQGSNFRVQKIFFVCLFLFVCLFFVFCFLFFCFSRVRFSEFS